MALSELKAQLQVKFRKAGISFKDNNKIFFKEYPHYLKFEVYRSRFTTSSSSHPLFSEHMVKRDELNAFVIFLEDYAKKKNLDVRTRKEWHRCTLFCKEPEPLIKAALKYQTRNSAIEIVCEEVGIMSDAVLAHSVQKVDGLPKATNLVVKSLPLGQYRYRVFFATGPRLRRIGSHAMEAIVDQINNHPSCSKFEHSKREALIDLKYYSTNYFYTVDEDIFPILYLINHEFITKIEKFTLFGELNE